MIVNVSIRDLERGGWDLGLWNFMERHKNQNFYFLLIVKVNQECNIMGKFWCGNRPLEIPGCRLGGEKASSMIMITV
jgi:hypothetical protein